MNWHSSASDTPFSWPPPSSDIDRIQVVEVAQAQVLRELSTATAPATRRGRRRRRVRSSTTIDRTTRDGWVMLACGLLVGALLPGFEQARPLALALQASSSSTTKAVAASDPEVQPTAVQGDVPATPTVPTAVRAALPPAAEIAVAPPAAGTPRPRRAAARRFSRESVRATATAVSNDRDTPVRHVLAAYEQAWTRMDADTTRALWPSAEASTLHAAFAPVSEQRLQLAGCDVGMSGDRALAICMGTLTYRPRAGNRAARVERGRWEFDLHRTADGWRIGDVDRARRPMQ